MAKKLKYDFRTEREKKRDEECDIISKRFRELAPLTGYMYRVFAKIGEELCLKPTTVRDRCIRMGLYTPGNKRGRNSGNQVRIWSETQEIK